LSISIVRSLAVPSPSTVELKVMLLSVVVNVTSVDNVTAPEYVCVPEVVILPPRSEVPVIVNSDEPVEF
jgi:hypothetical protein